MKMDGWCWEGQYMVMRFWLCPQSWEDGAFGKDAVFTDQGVHCVPCYLAHGILPFLDT
jgi:hypothetical protein